APVPRAAVPEARGAGDAPLVTDLDGRTAAARHLAGARRGPRRGSRTGRRGSEGSAARGCAAAARAPPRAGGQGSAHGVTLSLRPLIDLLQGSSEIAPVFPAI